MIRSVSHGRLNVMLLPDASRGLHAPLEVEQLPSLHAEVDRAPDEPEQQADREAPALGVQGKRSPTSTRWSSGTIRSALGTPPLSSRS